MRHLYYFLFLKFMINVEDDACTSFRFMAANRRRSAYCASGEKKKQKYFLLTIIVPPEEKIILTFMTSPYILYILIPLVNNQLTALIVIWYITEVSGVLSISLWVV